MFSLFVTKRKDYYFTYKALTIFSIMASCTACYKETGSSQENLLVFAASSLTNSLEEIKSDYEENNAINISINYAGSSTLARQILNGARADIYISANREWADVVKENKEVLRRSELLSNRLVVITHRNAEYVPKTLSDLANPRVQRIAISNTEGVPAGIYAKKILKAKGLWPLVKDKLILGSDVRHTMAQVENGGAEVGIVYLTDQLVSPSTEVSLEIKHQFNNDIIYPILLLKKSNNDNRESIKFYNFLSSDQALDTFQKYGFMIRKKE